MGYDLWQEIDGLCKLNASRVIDMRRAGVQKAENEAKYREALAIGILEERTRGTPVTIIRDVCLGRSDISELRLRRDTAETIYESYKEEINANKLRIRVLSEQLAREWSVPNAH